MAYAGVGRIASFESIPQEELAALSANAATRNFPKHAIVVSEGDAGGALYILLSGRVKFFLIGDNGREFVLGGAGPGEYFGEIALDGGPRSASVMTLDACRCTVVARDELQAFVASHPAVALAIMRNLSRRVRTLTETVKKLALSDVYGRVAHLLLENTHDGRGEIALSQQAIADRVGASRQMVSRILGDLTTGGYVARQGRRLVVLRRPPQAW